MQRKFIALAVVCLFTSLTAASAQNLFKVNERETKAFFAANVLQTDLVLENGAGKFQAKIKLEILDADDRIVAENEIFQAVRRGKQTVPVSLLFAQNKDEKLLVWNRLRYAITNSGDRIAGGVVSLSEIMPDIFELRAAASDTVFGGMNYRVRVRAFHPTTGEPTANVKISGEVKLNIETTSGSGDALTLTAAAKTDRAGYAGLDFKIPDGAKPDDDGVLIIRGERNGITSIARESLDAAEAKDFVYLNTDKPIYQPEQQLYARGLYMTRDGAGDYKIAAGRELKFTVEDEDDTILYRETVKTSTFGVASIGWKIPDDAKLGTYQIRVKGVDDDEIGLNAFKVSRYDLPNFTVAAKPDKTYYLPADKLAEITVSAEYLFGKAVEKGAVKVVREKERRWNYDEQKYETEAETPLSGETNEEGKFTARVDLSKAHAELKSEEYKRFEDLHFAAYFTDASSNRTEQKRFDVRVSRDAIHVYLVGADSYDEHNPKLPVEFYVSTFYADGAPAACDIEIKGKYEDEPDEQTKILTRLKTNSLGAGRAEFAAPPRSDAIYFKDLQIRVIAADAQNRTGKEEEEIDIDQDEKQVQIRTAKAIYRNGEAIIAEIASTETDGDVFVDVVKNSTVVHSHIVRLKNNRASISIAYNRNFKGSLTVAAYIDDDTRASKGVVFPQKRNLNLDVRQTKTVYRPNEEARVDFTVESPDKKRSETALGVVVFDRAIEERARTDAEFGGAEANNQFGNFYSLLDDYWNQIDTSKPISKDLQLKAELAFANASYHPNFFGSDFYGADLKKTFENYFNKQFKSVETWLKIRYAKDFTHPASAADLQKILLENGVDFANLRDPWGNAYRAEIKIEGDEDALYIRSAGANKTAGDADDFVVLQLKFKYFTPTGNAIDQAVRNFHARADSFVRDYAALRDELKKQNVDLDNLKDRFGRPYRITFGISQRFFTIEFRSSGADGRENDSYRGDDFSVWTNRIDYFADTESRIQTVLNDYATRGKSFPQNENEFKEILKNGVVDFASLRDGWNQPLRLEFSIFSRYADRVKTEVVGRYGEAKPSEKSSVTPVTQQIAKFSFKSVGADGRERTYDDFNLTTFSGVVAEQSKDDDKPVEQKVETVFTGGKGAVRGTITDPTGAVVPGVKVTATNEESGEIFESQTNEDGIYILKNLPSGKYTIKAEASGFTYHSIENVPVRSSTVSVVNFQLEIGDVSQTVNVTAGADVMNTTDAQMSTVSNVIGGTFSVLQETATPRLREYFPETLVWQPELITDKNGKAQLKFKLADNLTTWKLYAIASNAAGKVGIAAQEIKTFQPFFIDLEPPKNLTVGDRIGLPVQVRNYTEKTQKVSVSMAAANWFSFLNQANQTIDVLPNKTENAIFDFRADAATKQGKQRVTATAAKDDADAIEKTIAVHPNGKEIVQTRSEIFRDAAAFDVNFPADALPKTQTARVKIYPNLLAHVAESIEGLLMRPAGCGEQTISSTYPNLMILKAARNSKVSAKLETQARKYLRQGLERLSSYQTGSGGFSFWGASDTPDAALTAYAIRFLSDARVFAEVDEDAIARAQKWLAAQQRADGSWTKIYSWEKTEDKQRTKILTTYIARVLAMTGRGKKEKSADAENALRKSLDYLRTRNAEIDEPFALASFALALFDAGDEKTAREITAKLETLAIEENGGAYWNLETNTPFYGWGTAGRIETTALVVQALLKDEGGRMRAEPNPKSEIGNPKSADLILKGTTFLLKNKDRYGVWYSTQATVNVLDAILAVVGEGGGKSESAANRTAEIFINNRKMKEIALPAEDVLAAPVDIDLSDSMAGGENRVEIKIGGKPIAAMAQIVSNYYVSWRDFNASGRDANQSRRLRLAYDCDRKEAAIMQEINCAVEAERSGFRGYGMLLAEIGLPPGADVDRASLEKSKAENWSFSRYEILPDRIVVYMWAQAGGTRINFKFKPRYAIEAQSAASIVYDYYNAEAQATLPPLKFSVK